MVRKYKVYINKNAALNIHDVSYTANTGRDHYDHRIALIAMDIEDLDQKLNLILRSGSFDEINIREVFYGKISETGVIKKAGQDETPIDNDGNSLKNEVNRKITQYMNGDKNDLSVLEDICKLYTGGTDIEWELLYSNEKRKKVRLPAYAFERHSCWLDLNQSVGSVRETKTDRIFYGTRWKKSAISTESSKMCQGTVLVLKDNCGLADNLIENLRLCGRKVLEIEIGNEFEKINEGKYVITGKENEYKDVFAEYKGMDFSQIVHLSSVTGKSQTTSLEDLEGGMYRGVYGLFYLTRALHANHIKSRLDIILVSEYANGVTEEQERVEPVNAALFAMGKVIGMEDPLLRCRCIDIDANTDYENILCEINAGYSGYISAYRKGIRYTEEIVELDIPE